MSWEMKLITSYNYGSRPFWLYTGTTGTIIFQVSQVVIVQEVPKAEIFPMVLETQKIRFLRELNMLNECLMCVSELKPNECLMC